MGRAPVHLVLRHHQVKVTDPSLPRCFQMMRSQEEEVVAAAAAE
jgi:hypothetical protein